MIWSSRFHVHHRTAQTTWKDRIVLAGDAAHVHSPAGGQGMNTGIQDAVALAEWSRVRLEIAHGVVRLTDALTHMATLENCSAQLLRNAAMSLIGHAGFLKEKIAENLAELK